MHISKKKDNLDTHSNMHNYNTEGVDLCLCLPYNIRLSMGNCLNQKSVINWSVPVDDYCV